MAVPVFPGRNKAGTVLGPFAWDAWPNPTKLYIYAIGVPTWVMKQIIGRGDKTGAAVDGYFTDQLQDGASFAAANDSIDMGTGFTLELDTDADSPYRGEWRLSIALASAAS